MYATYFTIPEGRGRKERMGRMAPNALGSATSEGRALRRGVRFLVLLQPHLPLGSEDQSGSDPLIHLESYRWRASAR